MKKAEGDYDNILLLVKSRKVSRHDNICYHSQQCVEKYLKAKLTEAGIRFPKTHDLSVLLVAILPSEPLWQVFTNPVADLAVWAVKGRYPGTDADFVASRESLKTCQAIRKAARASFGLPTRQ